MSPEVYDHLTRLIYAGACDDEAFVQALRVLAEHHGCNSAAFVYADRELPSTDIVLTHGPFSRPEVRNLYFSEFADLDPAPNAMAGMPVGTASATDRLFTPEFMSTSRFVNEFYRPLGLEEALGGPVISSEGRTGLVAIHRGRDRGPFSDDEIAHFGRLLPHFGQALKLRRIFFAALEGRQVLAEALEPASQAVVLLDAKAEVLHANAKARALLARNDGLALTRTGQFMIQDVTAARNLQGALCSAEKAAIIRIPRSDDARPYALRVGSSSHFGSAGSSGAILYIFDPDHRPFDALATLRSFFGLSRQAATLVTTLMWGGDLATYAASTGVSRDTAKFHLKSAFAATGTTRQADLVMLVTSVLRDLGDIGSHADALEHTSSRSALPAPTIVGTGTSIGRGMKGGSS